MSDPGDARDSDDRGQHKEVAAMTSVSSEECYKVIPHPEGSPKEEGRVPKGVVGAEEGRKWARKGSDGRWSAISESAPWAGVEFVLTEERDCKYEGNYLSGHPEDDSVQLQNVLRDATEFEISRPKSSKSGTKEQHHLFLVESFADVLQMGDKPTPVLLDLTIFGYGNAQIAEQKPVLEGARKRVLQAARLMIEAAQTGKLNKLKWLVLVAVGLDDAGLQAVADVIKAGQFRSLTSLFLVYNDFGLKGAIALAQAMESRKLLGLQTLGLSHNNLGDDCCEAFESALCSGSLEALDHLFFAHNDIGDRGAQALARGFQSGRVKKLACLDLSYNRIGDDGMVALATSLAAGKCPEVIALNVGDNSFRTKGIHSLAKALESGNLNSLLKLSISNGQRSEADVKPLVVALSVNQALTVDLDFDGGSFMSGLRRQHKQLVKRNSKYMQLLAQVGENLVPASFAKVYLCGNPEVGKTTLRKSMTRGHVESFLTRERKKREEPRTRGIEISTKTYRGGKDDKRDISLAFWDMAGQDEYHKLHSSFLCDMIDGKAAIFVVVCTTQTIEKAEEELKYWLRFIASSVDQNVKNLRDVFVVVNRWGRNVESNVNEWKHMVLTLSKEFQGHLNIKRVPFIVDVRMKTQVESVEDALVECSREMLKDEMIPDICHFIRTDVNNWEATTCSFPVLSRAEFDQVLNRRGANWDDMTIEAALVYLNEVGVLIYINKQLVVLEPNWFCREIVGNMFLTRDMRRERVDLFRSKVDRKTGSILISSFKNHFQALLGIWDEINVHYVLTILLWVGFCYKGHNENLFIPALIDEDDTPGDRWYGGNLEADREGQWVMGYCVEHAPDEKCLAPIALWHKFQIDDLDSNTRKQCQVDLASDVVEMLLEMWTQVCPGINSIQRVVWPWLSSQPRRPKTDLENDMDVASINDWVQERGVGRILQRLVGGTPISGDQLLSTKSKKLLLNSMEGNIQGGKSRLGEAMTLGIFSSDLLEGVVLNEELSKDSSENCSSSEKVRTKITYCSIL